MDRQKRAVVGVLPRVSFGAIERLGAGDPDLTGAAATAQFLEDQPAVAKALVVMEEQIKEMPAGRPSVIAGMVFLWKCLRYQAAMDAACMGEDQE